jgi:hypothetical protein
MITLHLLWVAAIVVIAAAYDDYKKKRMEELEFRSRHQGEDLEDI